MCGKKTSLAQKELLGEVQCGRFGEAIRLIENGVSPKAYCGVSKQRFLRALYLGLSNFVRTSNRFDVEMFKMTKLLIGRLCAEMLESIPTKPSINFSLVVAIWKQDIRSARRKIAEGANVNRKIAFLDLVLDAVASKQKFDVIRDLMELLRCNLVYKGWVGDNKTNNLRMSPFLIAVVRALHGTNYYEEWRIGGGVGI